MATPPDDVAPTGVPLPCGPGGPTSSEVPATIPPPEADDFAVTASLVEFPRVPGYEVLGELGRGGMGVVYRARQTGLGRTVALKMILAGAHAGPDERARFRREAEAMARLSHPNIVQVYEVGEHDRLPFFSLEFCPGGSLERMLAGTPLPAAQAAALVENLARAMQGAHDAGVVHRDLEQWDKAIADYSRVIEVKPDDWRSWWWRGLAYARLGQHARAVPEYSQALKLGADEYLVWYQLALLQANLGNAGGYREVCASALLRFAATEDAETAHFIARACTLTPDAGVDVAQPVQLAEKAAAKDGKSYFFPAWSGAAAYRAGRFEDAVRRLKARERSTVRGARPGTSSGWPWPMLAWGTPTRHGSVWTGPFAGPSRPSRAR